ncbi:hypothetical protein SLS63_010053 [Diaporthe eres]|uniref:Ubiquitin-like protease family profile domain-containing protein n=1 Tax=Diaporthe eres TaxID=83184 RepID=A0ABR1NY12_DIAER
MPIVDECMQFHLSYLPPETSRILNYQLAYHPTNPSNLFDRTLNLEDFQRLNREFRKIHQQFFDNIGKATWTILPLAVNEHFTAVILHAKAKDMPNTKRGFRTVITSVAVIEPERNAQVEKFIWERLQLILTAKRGFTFKHDQPVKLWFPKQWDTNTCGFRVYEIMRIMTVRISQSAAEEGLKDGYNPRYIWQNFSGDFQPDKVRAEMIGILANVAMRYTHWSTRICICPVSHVKDRSIGSLPDTWIPTEHCGARLSDLPKRNAMQYSEDVMVDRLLRLEVAQTPDPMQTSPDWWNKTLTDDANGRRSSETRDWGLLPRQDSAPSTPTSSPPPRRGLPTSPLTPPPSREPDQTVTPAPPVSGTGPGPSLAPLALITPPSGLPPALSPGLPIALVKGSRAGVFVPTGPGLNTPPRSGPSPLRNPFETPEEPKERSPDNDIAMEDA